MVSCVGRRRKREKNLLLSREIFMCSLPFYVRKDGDISALPSFVDPLAFIWEGQVEFDACFWGGHRYYVVCQMLLSILEYCCIYVCTYFFKFRNRTNTWNEEYFLQTHMVSHPSLPMQSHLLLDFSFSLQDVVLELKRSTRIYMRPHLFHSREWENHLEWG